MRPPAFWDASPFHPAARLLSPLGALYGRRSAARMDLPGTTLPCPVLCIGNFTLGGAGKTPTALAVAGMLRALGATPAFLTRGYGGRLAGPVAVDPDGHTPIETGDEALLLARRAPTIVARDRVAGARACLAGGADVVVMDDGLQNPSLRKTLSLAVVDAGSGIGNGLVFPAGPLRVPLTRQWPHVHGVIVIGEGTPGIRLAEEAERRGLTVHRARLVPGGYAGTRPVLAFAGIGRPEKFFATLREAGAEIAATQAFPDHHPYSARDLAALATRARALGADLVTTAKDHVRLPRAMAEAVAVLDVTLGFTDAAAVEKQLAGLLARC